MTFRTLALAALLTSAAIPASAAVTFAGYLSTPGNAQDLSGLSGAGNAQLSYGSDSYYDASSNTYYGITDRGPGGGVYSYAPRVNTYTLSVNHTTGLASNFQLKSTVIFKQQNGTPYNGLNPTLLNGTPSVLGGSFDSEGFVKLANGNFLVSDEYGPSIVEFDANGNWVRTFTPPSNIVPRQANGTANYTDGRPIIQTGRQDNRGFEGLTVSPDGTKVYAILQDPLVNEGQNTSNGSTNAEGRYSRNLRIVAYDYATGTSSEQYIYTLNSVPGFGGNNAGRSIGVSSITATANGKFLVIERDNLGVGVTDPTGTATNPQEKSVFLVDLAGATNVANISLSGTNTLPAGVTAATKTLFIDVLGALKANGVPVAEKMEGLSIGPRLAGGGVTIQIATDNDFSTTQNASLTQFYVCTTGFGAGNTYSDTVTFGAACPTGMSLIPTFVYSFAVTGDDARALGIVPEPATWAMMIAGFGLVGAALRRRGVVTAAA